MEKNTLYEKGRLKITYLHNPEPGKENEIVSFEDHELWIKEINGDWGNYILQRGVLRELAHTAKERPIISLMNKLDIINPTMWDGLIKGMITFGDLGKAFIGAYQKEEEDFEKFLAEQKSQETH